MPPHYAVSQILNSLDTGADCSSENQEEVNAAQGNLDQANKDKTDADAAAAAAAAADVNFSPKQLSSLTPGQCDDFFTDPAYTSAKAAAEAAKSAATQAAGALTAAEAGFKAAQEAQQEAIAECKCSAKKAYDAAWEAANANNDANEKAYTKGMPMKCVLAGTLPASCSVGAIPKVTAITLADGVESTSCFESKSVTCTLTIDNVLDSVKYNGESLSIQGDKDNWKADKTVTFTTTKDGGTLVVTGHDLGKANNRHCKSAGFQIQCSSDDSFWGSFTSGSSNIKAAGKNAAAHSFKEFAAPCTSTSKFYLPANRNLKKLWAPKSELWAEFEMGPSVFTPSPVSTMANIH